MKKVFFAAGLAFLLASCGSKGKPTPQMIEESVSDSLFAVNDSTVDDWQTYTYEGILAAADTNGLKYQLALQGLNPDSLKSYSLTISTVETSETSPESTHTFTDQGTVITLVGTPDDSTAVVYQLVSAGPGHERTNFLAEGDSLLTLLGHDFKKACSKVDYTLRKKL